MTNQAFLKAPLDRRVALITGITGFIGAHLARRLLEDGWEVHAISRHGSKLPGLLTDKVLTLHLYDGRTETLVQCLHMVKPNIVFHLASLFLSQHESSDIELLIDSNVLFGNQLLEAMRVNGVRNIINTGTSWQHYENRDYNPVCLYAATKQAFEVLLEYYVEACGFKAITLKLFDTYGPNDSRPKLFFLLRKAFLENTVLNMSEGEQLIDLVYIDDVINAYLIAARRVINNSVFTKESYAVSSLNPTTLRKIVELYQNIFNRKIRINWGGRPYRDREVMKTWTSGVGIEGWVAKTSLVEGMRILSKSESHTFING